MPPPLVSPWSAVRARNSCLSHLDGFGRYFDNKNADVYLNVRDFDRDIREWLLETNWHGSEWNAKMSGDTIQYMIRNDLTNPKDEKFYIHIVRSWRQAYLSCNPERTDGFAVLLDEDGKCPWVGCMSSHFLYFYDVFDHDALTQYSYLAPFICDKTYDILL